MRDREKLEQVQRKVNWMQKTALPTYDRFWNEDLTL